MTAERKAGKRPSGISNCLGHRAWQVWQAMQSQGVLLATTSSYRPSEIIFAALRGEKSMVSPIGQEPLHAPHWMQVWNNFGMSPISA
jgi:hypothetical protein